ncbi:hypothetical protein ACO1O0_006632 [Amphichorda felina]
MTPSPLHLTIRFSTSLPDLDLDVPSPQSTTVLSLKHLLRNRIDSRCRLRLIHQGRLLPDTAALSSVLKAPPPPPPPSDHDQRLRDPTGKGKAVAGDPPLRIYVNCSIADELSPEELAAETAAAEKPPDGDNRTGAGTNDHHTIGGAPPPSTRPRPRGFDRLLTSGFTSSEISTLRTQFASIHADRYPPDAPPSPDTMRRLEDSWIDTNAGQQLPGPGGADADDPSGLAHGLDVLVSAMMIGFFFPLGSLMWALRQDNIWGDRWQIFVAAGVVLSLTTGLVINMSGGLD